MKGAEMICFNQILMMAYYRMIFRVVQRNKDQLAYEQQILRRFVIVLQACKSALIRLVER